MSRYLTPAEKARELETWFRGSDIDDPGARDLCNRLNQLEGVCTVQSCIGHVKPWSGIERHVENGQVELRLDSLRTELFYEAMPAIRATPGVDHVEIHWRVASEQRCTVWFVPGSMPAAVAALEAALSKSDAGARLDPNPGALEEQCA